MKRTHAQILLGKHLRELKLKPTFEYQFCEGRRWRFDVALLEQAIAIEIEGGIWTGGRHTRGAGYLRDLEKYNTAVLLGWRPLRFTPQQVMNGEAKEFIAQFMRESNRTAGEDSDA